MNKKATLNCSFGTYQKENMRYFILQSKNNLGYINSGGSIFCAISFYFYFKIFLFQNSCFKISISKLLFQHFSFKISVSKFLLKNFHFQKFIDCTRLTTCALTGFFWLLSHVIYLKLTRVL